MELSKLLLVIVGETASGKTALAIELAQRFNGEIVCADSRTLYKGMDIAMAKPTPEEQAKVKHHLINISTPDNPITAADFKRLATGAIDDITERGKLPIMVGGTGLYIDAVLYDYQFIDTPDKTFRNSLATKELSELQGMLAERGLPLPENLKNKRHLIRALEIDGAVKTKAELRPNTLVLGLQLDRELLKQRITARINKMFAEGVLQEAASLRSHYPTDIDPLKTPGYKALWRLLDNEITEVEAKAEFALADLHLAKRQRTWFKRNKSIHWLNNRDNVAEAVDLITTILNT